MKNLLPLVNRFKWRLTVVLLFAGTILTYNTYFNNTTTESTSSFFVVSQAAKGEVTSGIEASGEIIAAQKLDLDVYKQLSRIDVVNVSNGSHVTAGEVLVSFDKSDAYVGVQSSAVEVAAAELSLDEAKKSAVDPNTTINTLKNQIANYQKTINESSKDKEDAYIDFLNTDLEIEPSSTRFLAQSDRTYPVLSGRYESTSEGTYTVTVYASGADSGYSYKISGLETMTNSLIFGKTNDIGTRGLKLAFPNDTKSGDVWVITLPNTNTASYTKNKTNYKQSLSDIDKAVRDAKVALSNAETELATLERTDTSSYRDLSVSKANASLSEARQKLSSNYDVVQEMDIVAPFNGSIEGMENVVVGATPTGGESDTISLGTLISDEFLTTFTLGASDVAKVEVGQRVKVTVTSFSEQPSFEAVITEISSLPESSGVAQYEVRALLTYDRSTATNILREGMLADIEVVEEEKVDALRIPTSAITYEQGVPKVTVLDSLTEEQKTQVERMGIIRTDSSTNLPTYTQTVQLGIIGQYYIEILSGLEEGDLIITTSQTESASESVVGQSGFGPGRSSSGNQQPPSQPNN
jgi:multidrug efflux pump subunit AcrA (membrane-fusion protein)